MPILEARPELAARFESRVDRSAGELACHPWTGSTGPLGYGYLTVRLDGEALNLRASRLAWVLAFGEDPPPHQPIVRHTVCDNPICVNVVHLHVGTYAENMADRDRKGRQARGSAIGRAVLSEADVWGIWRLHGQGVPQREIARRYGVSPGAVCNIIAGRFWAWLLPAVAA